MATSLTDFKGAIVHGGARPSLFEFVFTATPTDVSTSLGDVKLYCNVSEIPPLTLTPIERQYFGRTVKIPGDLVFGELTTTIINTEDFGVRNEIEKWMEFINSTVANESKADVDFGTGSIIRDQILNVISNYEPRVTDVDVSVNVRPDSNEFDVTVVFNIIGQEIPTQQFTFILEATR